MQPIGRNEPCPCGSGKRYKDCHGNIGGAEPPAAESFVAALQRTLTAADQHLLQGDFFAAQRLAQEALQIAPQHPEALRILASCDFEQGDPEAGLQQLLAAARSMPNFPLSPQQQFRIWSELGSMFTHALAGKDSTFAINKRNEYALWKSGSGVDTTAFSPLVSIIFLADGPADWQRTALLSVIRQTYASLELIVVRAGSAPVSATPLDDLLDACPFPWRIIAASGTSVSSRLNEGVRASSGAFVNVLEAHDYFHIERVSEFVRQVVNRGRAWGFSRVEFIDREGRMLDSAQDATVAVAKELFATVEETDTVGFSFIHQSFVAVAPGNLFFSRALFDRLDGFRDLPHYAAWDFALRALWYEEPAYFPEPLYTHRPAAGGASQLSPAQAGVAQVAMFREFYAGACGETAPPNRFAPSLHHWSRHFLKTPFQVGHVLAFPLEELQRLGARIVARPARDPATESTAGINLVGFAYGEFGLGENLRALANACRVGEIPFVVRDVDLRLRTRQADRSIAPFVVDELRYKFSLFCLNPDMLKPVVRLMKPDGDNRRYNAGFWFWELEQVPRGWSYAIDSVDEIWVATEFIADAMRLATTKPVTKVHTPIEFRISRPYTRAEFGLPEDRFLFLFSFDFNSFAMRKNPEGAIAAFQHAFGNGREDVGLVIKSINGGNSPDKLREMQALIGDDRRIVITDGFMSRDQMFGLQSVADAYVSLHRAEGLGLGLAESMYLGKPVIGTAYSGNLEFMSTDNSCLVGYQLVPIEKGQYLVDDERFRWADPDVGEAAHFMRRLVDDTTFRERIARRGQHDIRSKFSYAETAASIRNRLNALGLL